MHIVVVGLNYRTAPVEVRERFTFAEQDLPKALEQLKLTKSVLEGVVVATCNRTEIYVVVDRLHMCGYFIRSFMEQWFGIPRDQFTQHLYIYEDEQAIRHLFRVTCGLDSMVIGETQILGQVKNAFLQAQSQKITATWFNMLFKQAVTLGKRAHSETSIGESAVSVSYAAVELGKRIFGMFTDKKVLILGAGKMSELTVKHLYSGGAAEVIVANRTLSRAEDLASKFNGTPVTMEEGMNRLADVDIVISSTGAQGYILDRNRVEASMKRRQSRPLFMIDIAVPRDLDPAIGELQNVFLYDIDDLEGIVESNLEMRRTEAAKIEHMIEDELSEFYQWLKTMGVRPVIRALQEKSESIHQDTLESLYNKLPELDERQRKVISRLTKSMLNQMMHDPINRVKELAVQKQGNEALDMFSHIFALEDRLEDAAQKVDKSDASALIKPEAGVHGKTGQAQALPASFAPASL
ncbi:glutamyl-tRNA reductase [Paenibacillus polymyxa]|jgi:glutamyl-tRNA reductase|uniref:glutamyl-tRNA reductase n=1 Tax=Paenibacillus TaxID=44249 RepID=UPI0003078A66|nr:MULTISPECIES: glutamyl-tRNA reductase [Paenibacillus]AIY08285.1 glutamyl-tRNA reductase [Paenibacillus polymyxa]KAE8560977.1 glutamyl-tRNA reductase [Paenibacillus polymyxa]KAF6617884.1 glutamyl-tRNA reductase [Paenibacillus sp. EKM101P]KAF6618693.1 glutamyl-tRNA reductase [Paenibacillus sp. EKM102P]KAF6626821.1 glutamyl-tRNA reductase [Paenibacillus sp. EKM10P]